MFLLTAEEMRRLDELSIKRDHIPSSRLMENAGLEVFKVIRKVIPTFAKKKGFIFCGPGNNGGDGRVVARHLKKKGCRVVVFNLSRNDRPKKEEGTPDFIVDAIFGTGLARRVSGLYREMIAWCNKQDGVKISLDIPSGLDADNGGPLGIAFQAHHTVTLGFPKRGFFLNEGPEACGRIHVVDIGLSPKAIRDLTPQTRLITRKDIQPLLRPRPKTSHKGSFGHVFVIGCSRQKLGAGILASKAALKVGAGLVTLVLPCGAYKHIPSEALEIMYEPVGTDNFFKAGNASLVLETTKKASVVAMGPGLGLAPETVRFVHEIVSCCPHPLVLDADALNAVAKKPSILKKRKNITLLTPHPAEMGRLIGRSAATVQKNRLQVARDFSVRYGVVVLLKGYRSLVAFPDGTVWVNPTGNPAMASAGQGDALTGIYAGLLSQYLKNNMRTGWDPSGYSVFLFGCFLHGLVGDLLACKGQRVVPAGDIINNLNLGWRFLKSEGELLKTVFY